jgi:hypothetical protein
MDSRKECFWIATLGSAQTICGVGKNQRQAIQNAMKHIGGNTFTPVMFECIRCTPELYHAIDQKGIIVLSWERDELGVARLARHHSQSEGMTQRERI